MSKKNSILSMVFGILSISFGVSGGYGGFYTIAIPIAGLVFAILSMNFQKKAAAEGAINGFTKAGKITSIIGLIFCAIALVSCLVCGICVCAGVATGACASAGSDAISQLQSI